MRLSGTDFRLLKVFDAVVRHGGFAAAQTELNVGLSTISNHITALEQRLGFSLCQRGRGGFKLSDKGRLVHQESQSLLQQTDTFSSKVSALKGTLVGEIKIGIVDSVVTNEAFKLDAAFAEFLSEPNDIRFEIAQYAPQELMSKVLDGRLDIGVGSFPHKVAGLNYQPLHREVHSMYCAASHPLFSVPLEDLNLTDLVKEDVVGRGYWRDRRHQELGFENVKAVTYEIEPQLILIKSGKYIGYLPDHFADQWVKRGELRCLSPAAAPFNCDFDLVSKTGRKQPQALRKLIAIVRSVHAY